MAETDSAGGPQLIDPKTLQNFAQQFLSGLTNFPNQLLNPWDSRKDLILGGATPPPAPTGARAPLVNAPGSPLTRYNSTVPVPGTSGTTLFEFPTSPLPKPPTLEAPPQMATTPNMDLGAVRGFLDQGKPTGPDVSRLDSSKMAAILGGMARGAGGVDATQPGSFAKALAMWGGGGAEGMRSGIDQRLAADEKHNTAMSAYYQNRANQELQLQKMAADQAHNANLVGFENAKLKYATDVKNQEAIYKYQLEQHGLQMPKVSQNSQGVLIQQQDPTTGKTTVNFTDLTPTMQKLEKLDSVLKAMNIPGGEPIKLNYILQETQDPNVRDAMLRREAVREVFRNGAGMQVFGDVYKNAVEGAKRAISRENPSLISDTKAFQAAVSDRIMAEIMPKVHLNNDWIGRAAAHSYIASVISGAQQPPPTGR